MSSGYSSNPEVNCNCYIAQALAECCPIRVPQLTTGQTYHIYIQDKFNNTEFITGIAVGSQIEIDITEFPDAWLNQYAGDFILYAFNSQDLDTPTSFTFSGVDYQCILLRFVHVNPIPANDTIR